MKNKKLSLEDYLAFFDHRLFEVLTYSQLNQILSIHGFRQFKIELKNEVVDTVRSIDLLDLKRSTLRNEDVSPASLALNEVIRDLKDLKWDECHVSSIVTHCAPDSASSKTGSGEKAVAVVVPVRKRKARVKKVKAVSSVASTCTAMVVVRKGKRSKRVRRDMSVYSGAIVVAGHRFSSD